VIRDVFNEDFSKLIVSGDDGWEIIDEYVRYVAPHLADRISRWDSPDNETLPNGEWADDVFAAYRIDEQLAKALDRKVWLPSGGSLVIDRTEAMTVIDVNTGKFTGQGGNLEETVTRNNLEAAEEIVRQLRLRDVGGIIVIDFIDMVLESNRDLVLRRLLECLARDRTKHQVAEVTSLGLVQMTRKRVGAGLLEAFSQQCECCNGRGVIVALDAPAEPAHRASAGTAHRPVPVPPAHVPGNGQGNGNGSGNAKAGYGNGRRGNARRDDDGRDDDRGAREVYPSADLQAAAAQTDATQADAPRYDTVQASENGTAGNGARRTRRSTSAGTAFATAVLVEDTPALVPVVTTVPPVTDPAPPASYAPVVTGDTPPDPSVSPVRRTRTRAGSAVARVTIVTDPAPEPEIEPATEPEAVAEAVTPAAPVTPEPEVEPEAEPVVDAVTPAAPVTPEPADEPAVLESPADQEGIEAVQANAEAEVAPEPASEVAPREEPVSPLTPDDPAAWAAPADQGSAEGEQPPTWA
jgi:ribonuclease E